MTDDEMNSKRTIVAEFTVRHEYQLPKGIEKEQVSSFYVKWDILNLKLKDGTEIEVDYDGDRDDDAEYFKWPTVEKWLEESDDEDNN